MVLRFIKLIKEIEIDCVLFRYLEHNTKSFSRDIDYEKYKEPSTFTMCIYSGSRIYHHCSKQSR